jgi:hypothetical protein
MILLMQIPYLSHLQEVFGDTFEVYLHITRIVHNKIQRELGRDGPDWRVQNACHACCYKVSILLHNICVYVFTSP